MPSLAIIVVNYNTRDMLAACLSSVYASRCDHAFHVFVVDNRSTDGSAAMVAERFPQASLIASDRNGGFGYANNLALRHMAARPECPAGQTVGSRLAATGPRPGAQPRGELPASGSSPFHFPCDYVLFLNPDTVLSADALQATVDFLEAHPRAAVVGPKAPEA